MNKPAVFIFIILGLMIRAIPQVSYFHELCHGMDCSIDGIDWEITDCRTISMDRLTVSNVTAGYKGEIITYSLLFGILLWHSKAFAGFWLGMLMHTAYRSFHSYDLVVLLPKLLKDQASVYLNGWILCVVALIIVLWWRLLRKVIHEEVKEK